jgi:predicted nucleic acid-binding Zn ribbon protein
MQAGTGGSSLEICTRCTQPVPPDAAVCPHCSMPRTRAQPFTISIGIVGLLALIFVLLIVITAIRETDIVSAPPAQPQKAVLPR